MPKYTPFLCLLPLVNLPTERCDSYGSAQEEAQYLDWHGCTPFTLQQKDSHVPVDRFMQPATCNLQPLILHRN
ncbi:uncharacterized protein LY89DRAFT_689229 [Mollisia scopiformis]|uniref:Uncharacterized protein n=1 Tax=Mollisia scopiformis TaxID=149040 RepID=A0A194WUL9_MOLSC|nr:uncharacterized protein LY89DRAFT_689229 [Mollisia scopiformis]KUJ11364.1 hypothetical protein LY89DRAFT_689229 [Mollisia scopiformis]